MDRFLSLESFVAAVETGSISAASERVGTAKSVVSRRVQELEASLGVRLLNRNPRRLSTTDAGAEFYEKARRLLGELREAEESVGGKRSRPRGALRVAAPMSFTTLHFKSLVISLMRRHPAVVIDLDLSDRFIDLATGGHDCAVRFGRLHDSSLAARVVAPNRHVICASPDYLRRRGAPRQPADLRDHDGLLYTPREPHGMWNIEQHGELKSFRINARMRCNNGEVLQEAALAGMGLALLPTFMAASHVKQGTLEVVLPRYALPGGVISVVYVRDRHPSIKLRLLIDAMLAAYAPVPPWDQDAATRKT